MLPASVQQQSANFSLSNSDVQGRTIFTIRASHATQFKDENRALLQDVWITIYGRDGNRNDNIRTPECSYEPLSGNVRCDREVRIDMESVNPAAGKPAGDAMHVTTSNLSFNKNTGEASTPAPVQFEFSGGNGSGVGVTYSSKDSTVRVEHDIRFEMAASDRTSGFPVSATGSSFTVRRNDRVVVLEGPVEVRQGDRELVAGKISIGLDEGFHAQKVLIEGSPNIHAAEGKGNFTVAAEKFEGLINPAGWVQRITADGKVAGTRQTTAGTDRFQAGRAEFAMLPEHNLLKEMTATGGVTASSQQGKDSRVLKTDALHVTFAANAGAAIAGAASAARSSEKQRIETVESLAPANVQSNSADEATELRAQRIIAKFDENGRLNQLLGHSGVQVSRQAGKSAPQTSSASELAVTFGKDGNWDTLDESGDVRFAQADRHASAAHAKMSRANDTISLDGKSEFADATTRTSAGSVIIDQKSNEIHGAGGIVSTYLPAQAAKQGSTASLGSGAAHISADTVSGSSASGHVVYAGHARLWQGDSILEADQIEVWRDDKKMQATGHVVAAFPQTASPLDASFGGRSGPRGKAQSGPTLWTVRAPTLTYLDDQGKAHLDGGVSASSLQGSLTAKSLDLFLSAPGTLPGAVPVTANLPTGRQLSRVVAKGSVVVRQGERQGVAEQAEYTAAEEKFVLSGGQPTLIDNASSDTTTGRSLTFFVANDTILIGSQEGSRTITKHRVEK
jgi:LPS export ABC transporter protein LptC